MNDFIRAVEELIWRIEDGREIHTNKPTEFRIEDAYVMVELQAKRVKALMPANR